MSDEPRHPVDIVNDTSIMGVSVGTLASDPGGDVIAALEAEGYRLTLTSKALPRWVDPETHERV